MGTEIVGDIWLAHLVMPGMAGAKLAGMLLRAQVLTFSRRHHLISMNDEFPRKRITQDVPRDKMPRCYARCLRCGCVAWLSDWVKAAPLNDQLIREEIDRLHQRGNDGRIDFLLPCKGQNYMAHILTELE